MAERTRSWITAIATIVSVGLAAMTIYIIIDIAHTARGEEARNRSLSLITGFSSLASRQSLEALSNEIYFKDIENQTEVDTQDIRLDRYKKIFISAVKLKISEIRIQMLEILRLTDSVYACAWYLPQQTDDEERYCDREMLYVIYFPQLSSLFFAFRPLLYCDPAISKFYKAKKTETKQPLTPWERSIMYRVEEMMYDYLDWDHKTKELDKQVFYTHEAAKKAKVGEAAKRVVLRPSKDFCNQYPFDDSGGFV